MRRNALTIGIAAVALSLTAACNSGDGPTVAGSPSASTPSASTPPTSSASATAPSTTSSWSAKSLAVGECLTEQPAFALAACESGHTYEVYAVIPNSDNAGDLIKRTAMGNALCQQAAVTFLGSAAFPVTRMEAGPLPTTADPQSSSRYVCVASEYGADLKMRNTAVTGSLKGKLAGEGFYGYRYCLKERASKTNNVTLVPCTEPHQSEPTGGFLSGQPGQAFPGEAPIQKKAQSYCTPVGQKFLGTKTRRDIVASQNSGGRGPWSKGVMVSTCFVEVTSGTVTKTMRGILNKPLTSYR